MVISEANSVGTPAVGYDVPGVRDAIRHGETGLLAEPTDPAELARAALSLIADDVAYASHRERALVGSRQFSWQRTADLLLSRAIDRTDTVSNVTSAESRL